MEVTKQTILGLKVLSNDLNRSPLRFPSKFCLPESTSEFLVSQKKKALSLSDFLQQKDHENEVKKDFFFFWPQPQPMEVPGPETESEQQPQLVPQLLQCQILNLLHSAGIEPMPLPRPKPMQSDS